jgi:hypothetical protein
MILIIKGNNYKSWLRQGGSLMALIMMFVLYYNHMSDKFQLQNEKIQQELQKKTALLKKKFDLAKKIEKIIYKEAEKCIDLIGQEKIKSVKIVKNKLLIVCDWDANMEPLFVRYGVMALVKSTPENIKIAIDLKFMVESRYEV